MQRCHLTLAGPMPLESLQGCFSLGPLALVRPLTVVAVQPSVQIQLQLFDAQVDFLCESNRVKLVFARAMKPFADSVDLRILRLRLRMVDVVESQEELVVVVIAALPQYSVPRSVRILRSLMPCSSKNGMTRALSRSAELIGGFVM